MVPTERLIVCICFTLGALMACASVSDAQTRPVQEDFEAARSRIVSTYRNQAGSWFIIHDEAVKYVAGRDVETVKSCVEFLRASKGTTWRGSRRFALMCLAAMGERKEAGDAVLQLLDAGDIAGQEARATLAFMPPEVARAGGLRLLPWVLSLPEQSRPSRTIERELRGVLRLLCAVGDVQVAKVLREDAERFPAERDILLDGARHIDRNLALPLDKRSTRVRDELLFCQAIEELFMHVGIAATEKYSGDVARVLEEHNIRISDSFLEEVAAEPVVPGDQKIEPRLAQAILEWHRMPPEDKVLSPMMNPRRRIRSQE